MRRIDFSESCSEADEKCGRRLDAGSPRWYRRARFLKEAVFGPGCRKEELRIMREVVEVLSGIETSGLNV
jgi:hypothetical protein